MTCRHCHRSDCGLLASVIYGWRTLMEAYWECRRAMKPKGK